MTETKPTEPGTSPSDSSGPHVSTGTGTGAIPSQSRLVVAIWFGIAIYLTMTFYQSATGKEWIDPEIEPLISSIAILLGAGTFYFEYRKKRKRWELILSLFLFIGGVLTFA
ncbi:MAG: hypothetical protein AAF497_29420, partial [Planctomycetota bacterium]